MLPTSATYKHFELVNAIWNTNSTLFRLPDEYGYVTADCRVFWSITQSIVHSVLPLTCRREFAFVFRSSGTIPHMVDWFERLFGIPEGTYSDVKRQFVLEGAQLVCKCTGKKYGVGRFNHATVAQLRHQQQAIVPSDAPQSELNDANVLHTTASGRGDTYEVAFGDVAALHAEIENRHATFQVRACKTLHIVFIICRFLVVPFLCHFST